LLERKIVVSDKKYVVPEGGLEVAKQVLRGKQSKGDNNA
jgi:hypothetical protein